MRLRAAAQQGKRSWKKLENEQVCLFINCSHCAAIRLKILTNENIIKEANLKETSLYSLAVKCGIDDPREFVRRFINYDRRIRGI